MQGYSYVAPSILFSDKNNAIKEEILRPSKEMNSSFPIAVSRLNSSEFVDNIIMVWFHYLKKFVKFQNSPFFDLYEVDVKSGILGDGSFSICRRCVEKTTGKEYAVKIVSRKVDSTNEIALLKLCQGHENIVNLHNVYYDEVK